MFEQRRKELINAAIERCSGPQQVKLRLFQNELDEIRNKQPEFFMTTCFQNAHERLEQLQHSWKEMKLRIDHLFVQLKKL